MANAYDVDASSLVQAIAVKLKASDIKKPEYVGLVKSGPSRERVPLSEDFWFVRCASVLRHVYKDGPIGMSKLRTVYGSSRGHRVRRHHHMRAGGSMIKDAFDALEKLGYVKKSPKGREITPKGQAFVDKSSEEVFKQGE